jgi:hypothetical protein
MLTTALSTASTIFGTSRTTTGPVVGDCRAAATPFNENESEIPSARATPLVQQTDRLS